MGNDDNFDELVDKTEEHLTLLNSLSEKYPHEVLRIWFGVAINGRWDADAVGMVQHQLAQYAVDHTHECVLALAAMPNEEKANIIRFLADVENHYAYVEYPWNHGKPETSWLLCASSAIRGCKENKDESA